MDFYIPKDYVSLNLINGQYTPSNIQPYNNLAFTFWQRSLIQRLESKIGIDGWPTEWESPGYKDFFYILLITRGYLPILENAKDGKIFGPGIAGGKLNMLFQPTICFLQTPGVDGRIIKRELEIGKDCEMVRMTPDWLGVYDIICYFAEKLALNDTAVNTSLINSKVAYVLGAKTKAAAEALKRIFDKINAGEACAVYDTRIQDDPVSKTEPFTQLKLFSQADFITDKLLETHQTIIDEFDAEIGIKTVPYKKAERMVQSEAESKSEDSMARINLWIRTLNDSFKNVNRKYGLNLRAFIDGKEDLKNGEDNTVRM